MAKKKPSLFYRGVYFDYILLFMVLAITVFGLIMVYSASSYKGNLYENDSGYYFKKQLFFALIGVGTMILMSFVRYQYLRYFAKIILVGQFALLILVFVIGAASHGATRWIKIGPVQFQPSEIAKITLSIWMAKICTEKENDFDSFIGTIIHLLIPAVMVGIIATENLSTAVICLAIVAGIWFVSTRKPLYAVPFGIVAGLGVALFIGLKGYRGNRIDAWLHPETSENGYQTMQSLYAIGSGGLFGRGLGQSIQKLGFIPEAHNDMIFSVVCEELGIFGAACVIIAFALLIWRCKYIAEGARDRFGGLLVVGIMTHLAIQVIINISVVTNLMPNTGVTLPFISYGGTSLVFILAEMGIVLSVARQIVPRNSVVEESIKKDDSPRED